MTTDDAQHRRTARIEAADKTRAWGTYMMIAGGIMGGIAVTAFALSSTPEIQSWLRQTILTAIVILFSSGVALHAVGRSSRRTLVQLDEDHQELMTALREIKRNQTFLMARPGAGGTPGALHPPGPDTLDMVYKIKGQQAVGGPPKADEPPARSFGELADMAEWWNLATEVERRRHEPPDGTPSGEN